MNVIYPYLRNYSRELQWSIKSLENIEHGKVFVSGDDPLFPVDAQIIKTQAPYWALCNPYANVIFKVLDALEESKSEKFLLMNDDFFIMQPQEIVNYTRGTLESHAENRNSNDSYTQALKNTKSWLESRGYTSISFESHTPMIMDKHKFQYMFELIGPNIRAGELLLTRSLYGNIYNIESEELLDDPKNPLEYKGKPLLSTTEQSFLTGIGKYIRSMIQYGEEGEPEHTVSVIIPAYNAQDTIQRCLESIPNHEAIKEILVIDDCSTDNTAKIIKRQKDSRIKYYKNTKNKGVGYTFNELVKKATGDYILRIDSDDYFTKQIKAVIDKINGEDIIYYNMVDNDGTIRYLNPSTRMNTVACCHIFRREFIKDIKTIETNWGEDRYLMKQAVKKIPTELYTNLNAYRYNFPREGSLTDIKKSRDSGKTKENTVMLAIMSNCTADVLERPTILDTVESFKNTFGMDSIDKINIYVDPNPNPHLLDEYIKIIKDQLNINPTITESLSDGYRKALDERYDYIFFLEHDWVFQNITHNLNQIINTMQDDSLWFMLFNQHMNIDNQKLLQWQSYLRPKARLYCETDRISNNPHIIHRETYRELAMPIVDWSVKGAGRIEQVLEKKFNVAVYGEYNLPPTIVHIDGRRNEPKMVY